MTSIFSYMYVILPLRKRFIVNFGEYVCILTTFVAILFLTYENFKAYIRTH
jgi:hypothetical protein